MSVTDDFKAIILVEMDKRAVTNRPLAAALKNPKKNITDCTTFIVNRIKKGRKTGFSDPEVFAMAVEYYLGHNPEVGPPPPRVRIVTNRSTSNKAEVKEPAAEISPVKTNPVDPRLSGLRRKTTT